MNEPFDVVVVGAGLSGLMCAVEAARRGLTVAVLEACEQVGARYCYTGMGAAPLSNTALDVSRFHGHDARFVSDALAAFAPERLREWFSAAGVTLVDADYYGLVQPAGGGAEVIAAMLDALEQAGGVLETGAEVSSISGKAGEFTLRTTEGREWLARGAVIATGGMNLPQLGAVAYDLAEAAGHAIAPRRPAHVPVTVAEMWPGTLTGIWMDVELRLLSGKRTLAESTGSLLFTRGALTGEAVFNVSREVESEGQELAVNFHPGMDPADVSEWLRRVFGERTRESADGAIDHILPRRLGSALLRRQKVKRGARVMQLDEAQREGLLREMIDTRLRVTGTLGMQAAESCRGGVNVREVDPRTFASRRVPGLSIIGRVLDVSADWGGFEQHFALASGYLAAHNLPQ